MYKNNLKINHSQKYEKAVMKALMLTLQSRSIEAMAYARPRRSLLPVGCALLDDKGNVWTGSNIEVLWQHSFHAEEAAIINAMCHDGGKIKAICIAASRELFTPCGRCLDLIMEFAAKDCVVLHINPTTGKLSKFKLSKLIPYYPTRK